MKTVSKGHGNRLIAAVASGIALGASMMFSGSALAAGITGTAHDFSDDTGFNNSGEICKVCHTQHNAQVAAEDGPLWNRELTTATYTMYSGGTVGSDLDHAMGTTVSGVSKLCLSCHDGTIALDAFGGAAGTATKGMGDLFPTRNIGGGTVGGATADLANDHPVSFQLTTTAIAADSKIQSLASLQTLSTSGTSIQLFGSNDTVECAPCHDVHDDAGNAKLLRVKNSTNDGGSASGLCLTCHIK